jgi:hypothetical protein
MEASINSKSFDEGCKVKHKGAAISMKEMKECLKDDKDMPN